ncbi:MAG: helix-turn-helix transcriptional regulator [Niastella sp.]|nr:helix-turn-helix transcriptional regulator [Niastella sp.]
MNVLALHLYHFMDYARIRGIAWSAMAELIGGNEALRQQANEGELSKWAAGSSLDETAVVKAQDMYVVLAFIDNHFKDKAWGIQCGQFISMKLLGLIYRLSLQATTIQEALHYLQSYLAAAMPQIKADTAITDDHVTITFSIDNEEPAINRILLEYTLAVVGRELQLMAGDDTTILLSSPFYHEDYPAGWQSGDSFAVRFEPVILKAALRNQSHLHVDVLVPEYLKQIEQLKTDDSFAAKVKETLLSMSDPQLPDIQAVSGALHLTPRTLQRRLGAEGVTFRELLEDVKKQLCSFLLRHDRYTIAGIADILGYAEPASFIHSFRKWYGDSPERMRKLL